MELRIRGAEWKWADRHKRLTSWHKWFAWHLVRLGEYDVIWLETVQRKGEFFEGAGHYWWRWEYDRLVPTLSKDKRDG